MQPKFEIDSSGLTAAFLALQKVTGRSLRDVIRAEAGSILKAWAGRVKTATIKDVTRRQRRRTIRALGYNRATARGAVTINSGQRELATFGRVWVRTGNRAGRARFILGRSANFKPPTGTAILDPAGKGEHTRIWLANVADAVADTKGALTRDLKKAKGSIGLARQSVVQIADSLGIALERVPGGRLSASALAKARAALASDGRAHRNGLGREESEARDYLITLINNYPDGRKIALDRALILAINGRAAFYRRNLAQGVYAKLQTTLRAYPGLTVAPA